MNTTKLSDPNVVTLLTSARIDLQAAANLLPHDGKYRVNECDTGEAIERYLASVIARAQQALNAVQTVGVLVGVRTETEKRAANGCCVECGVYGCDDGHAEVVS